MRSALVCKVLALCAFSALASAADLQETKQPQARRHWAPPYPYPIGEAIQGLASGSTDVIVADVLETSPRRAVEGARDTVTLKVVEVFLGSPVPEETIDLYYHLLWLDEEDTTLEPPKFEKGKRYVVFLKSHVSISQDGNRKREYELADQWLSVMPERPRQAAEIAAAIRHAHGDARGAWSQSVGPLQGRLVAYRKGTDRKALDQTPVIRCFLDLRNVTGGDYRVAFDLGGASFKWSVVDENETPVAPNAPCGDDLPKVVDQKIIVGAGATVRLELSPNGGEIAKDRSGYLSLVRDRGWYFERSGETAYFLRGTIEIPVRAGNVWSGTLELPTLPIPTD